MIPDFHLHTSFSGDCSAPVKQQLEQAVSLGMKELCITDHNDYCVDSGDIDFNLDFEAYFSALSKLKEEYKDRIHLNIGVEMGLQPFLAQYCKEIALRYPFDFIIGSVHFVNGRDPYYPEYFKGRSPSEAYLEYFQTVLHCLQSCNDFDVLGHLDYVIRYGPDNIFSPSEEPFVSCIEQILSLLIEKGRGLECNTCGYRYGLGQPNPSAFILEKYRKMGGQIITLGSDAHEPANIGRDFKRGAELLKACGFSYYSVFRQRQPVFFKL